MPQAAKTAPKANGGDKQERKIVIPAEYVHAAKVLEYERARIVAAINANRTFLRMLDTAGALDDLEGEWLDVFYATKKKNVNRSDEAVAATKALRKAAREEIAVERGEDVPDTDEDEDEDEN